MVIVWAAAKIVLDGKTNEESTHHNSPQLRGIFCIYDIYLLSLYFRWFDLILINIKVGAMTCMVVDDNKMARLAMLKLLEVVPELELVAECESAIDAFNVLSKKQPDLIFLDIEMPGMSGIELIRNLGARGSLIIFTTAKANYAVEAFELNVIDYLLKPIGSARFLQSVTRAKEALESKKEKVTTEDSNFVFVRDTGILKRVPIDEILYLEAMGDYVKIHVINKFHIIHSTLKAIEEKLPVSKFMRVHRSYIVALNKIDFIEEKTININSNTIPVADGYKSSLNQRLNLI